MVIAFHLFGNDAQMKPSVLRLFGIPLIAASLGLVVIATAIGLWMDSKGFAVNMLAGIVGIFVGFVIGLFILDKYIEAKRKEQWARVRQITYASIANHLCDILQEAGISFGFQPDHLMNPISEGRDHLNPAAITAIGRLASELRELPGALSTDNTFSDMSVEFYKEVKWDLDQISEVLIPRVIDGAANQHVIDALIEFDMARLELRNAVHVHKRIAIGGIFPDVIQLLEQARVVYSALYDDSKL
jgi:hypothetical protein